MASSLLLFLLLILIAGVEGNAEVKALMELKQSLDPEGHVLSTWTNSGDPCNGDFEGVVCNQHGKVANISLQGKGLGGVISLAVAGLRCLNGLYLHYNALNGEIPSEIGNLTELTDLYLDVNNLTGSIPIEIGAMANLQVLQLCYNQLTGNIPTQLGLLKKLSVLALQSNQITGAIPASLGDLTQLVRLDLSFNRLFGSIPLKLAQISGLTVLNLRNNSLSGNVPSGLHKLNGGFLYSNNTGLCGLGFDSLQACPTIKPLDSNNRKPEQIPQSANLDFTSNSPKSPPKPSAHSPSLILISTIAATSFVVISGLLTFSYYRRQKQRIGSSLDVCDSRLSIDQSNHTYRKNSGIGSPLTGLEYYNGLDPVANRFNLEEVECATQYFSDFNLLGKSSFGTATYKGTLRDGSVIVVKRIRKSSCKSEEADFLKGLRVITMLRHENLVGLRGFCCSRGRGECFLVYDFMENGSLSDYLDFKGGDGEKVLDWATRVAIIKGVAKGMEYLHSNRSNKPSLLQQNLSAEKILLDRHLTPRISSSGLHKLLANDVIFSSLKASAAMGYLAPEYTSTGRFTEKTDMYAFGVLVLQVLSGKKVVSHTRLGAEFGKLEDVVDGSLKGNFSVPEAARIAGIGLVCTSELPAQRPTMEAVVQQLS